MLTAVCVRLDRCNITFWLCKNDPLTILNVEAEGKLFTTDEMGENLSPIDFAREDGICVNVAFVHERDALTSQPVSYFNIEKKNLH